MQFRYRTGEQYNVISVKQATNTQISNTTTKICIDKFENQVINVDSK